MHHITARETRNQPMPCSEACTAKEAEQLIKLETTSLGVIFNIFTCVQTVNWREGGQGLVYAFQNKIKQPYFYDTPYIKPKSCYSPTRQKLTHHLMHNETGAAAGVRSLF